MEISEAELNALIYKVIKIQNPDGSFGDENCHILTSYYLIAMVLYKRVKEPFLLSTKRALTYILTIKDDSPESYIALKLMRARTGFNKKETINVITFRENMDILGNSIYLYNVLLLNVRKFTQILLNEPMDRHQLIYYLFNQIINSE